MGLVLAEVVEFYRSSALGDHDCRDDLSPRIVVLSEDERFRDGVV